jgi:hypothetical protein
LDASIGLKPSKEARKAPGAAKA